MMHWSRLPLVRTGGLLNMYNAPLVLAPAAPVTYNLGV